MMSEIANVLFATMSPDANTRMQAEIRLAELFSHPETGIVFAQIAITRDMDLNIRQAAIIALRKYARETWLPGSPSFRGHACSPQVQEQIRNVILQGLSDPLQKIRSLTAIVVSTIAKFDWPESWPSLLPTLLGLLSSSDASGVHGAMRVLSELVRHELSEEQTLPLLQQLLPVLLNILGASEMHSPHTRARAVHVFRECLRSLDMVKSQYPKQVKQAVDQILPTWIDAFRQLLQVDPRPEVGKPSGGDMLMRIQIFTTLLVLNNTFPRYLAAAGPVFLSLCLDHLKLLAPHFLSEYVSSNGNGVVLPTGFLEDDEVGTAPQIAPAILDFLCSQGKLTKHKQWFESGGVTELVTTIVTWIQMTTDDEEVWESDINLFVNDEDDEADTYSIRVAAFELIDILFGQYLTLTATSMTAAVQTAMEESQRAQLSSDEDWWKPLEAALAVLSNKPSTEAILDAFDDQIISTDQVLYLMREVVPSLCSNLDVPFLQGRALIFASRYYKIVDDALAQSYIGATLSVLESPSVDPLAKVSCVRAIHNFSRNTNLMLPYADRVTRTLAPLLNDSTEDTLTQVLETLNSVVGLEEGKWMTEVLAGELAAGLLHVLENNAKDMIFVSILSNMFETLAASPYYIIVVHQTLPKLAEAIRLHAVDQTWYAMPAIDLSTSLMRGCRGPGLGQGFVIVLGPALFTCLLTADDRDIIGTGLVCLIFVVRKDCPQLLAYRDASGQNGLDHVFSVLARLLSPNMSEAGGTWVGDLIIHLFRNAGAAITPILPQLLAALLQRLPTAKTAPFIQSLITPFAYLLQTQRDTVLQLLESTSIPLPTGPPRPGLEILIKAWCENAETFHGFFGMRVSDLGLCQMFLAQRPSLNAITVQGDLIMRPETRNVIITRSKAKEMPIEYTSVPFPVKVIKLIVNSLSTDHDAEQALKLSRTDDADGDDEDEDWADEETVYQGVRDDDFGFLADMLEDDGLAADQEDEDLKEDPISKIDMQAYLFSFLRECATRNINNFSHIVDQLSTEETLTIRRAISSL